MKALVVLLSVLLSAASAEPADPLGLQDDPCSLKVMQHLAGRHPGLHALERLKPGSGSHSVFVVALPRGHNSHHAPTGMDIDSKETAVLKIVQLRSSVTWSEGEMHRAIYESVKGGAAPALVPEVLDVVTVRDTPSKGFRAHAILMEHMQGFGALNALDRLQPLHLTLAAEAALLLHQHGFVHGDLHTGNFLINEGQEIATIVDFQSAQKVFDDETESTLPRLTRSTAVKADMISLATEDLDLLRKGTDLTRREALDVAMEFLPSEEFRAIFKAPIQCELNHDCRDLARRRRRHPGL